MLFCHNAQGIPGPELVGWGGTQCRGSNPDSHANKVFVLLPCIISLTNLVSVTLQSKLHTITSVKPTSKYLKMRTNKDADEAEANRD